MMMSISVVLCCHNSARRLPATLRHLAAVDVPAGVGWEVLVVDNASTDDTAAQARARWAEVGAPAPLRVLAERRQGLNHARWTGIRAARGDIISFVDDDNWVDRSWLHIIGETFAAKPEVGAVGGLAEPVFEGPAPDWFARFEQMYACGSQGDEAGPVSAARGYLYGAGLSIRRSALLALRARGFSPCLLGRSGTASVAGGDDSELCRALLDAGWVLWYEPSLRLQHFMPAGRLSADYVRRLSFEMGRAAVRLDMAHDAPGRRPARRLLRFRPLAVVWYAARWLNKALPWPGRCRGPVGASYHLGRLAEAIGYTKNPQQ